MEQNLNLADRDAHLQSVIKSNLVSYGLSAVDIDCIVSNLTADILDVLDNFQDLNSKHES